MNKVDKRQFIIMDKPYEAENFNNLKLWDGKILSYHRDLKVVQKNGIVLLGYAFSVKEKEILLEENVLKEKRFWSGRWVLLYNRQLHMDASGNLGCAYAFDEQGEIYVSSSLHLLNTVLKRKDISNYQVKHGDGNGMLDYYPIPYTKFEGVMRLLPSQYIDFASEKPIQAVDDYMVRRYKHQSFEWIQDEFINKMTMLMRNIEREFPQEVWITLTGGVDSRAIFAVAEKAGIEFKTYTARRFNLKKWDKDYPKRIAKKYGRKHIYIDDTKLADERKIKEFDMHCAGCAVGTERQQYSAGSDIPIGEKAVVLWGTVWPIYIKAYHQCFCGTADTIEAKIDEIRKVCGDIVDNSFVHNKSLLAWLQWEEEHPIAGYDWRERMYLEQRTGAWVGTAAQAIDLFDSIRIAPINCQELLELLLSIDAQPGDKTFQKSVIERCCPNLKTIPYGEPTDIVYRGIRKIKRIINRLFRR